MDVFWKPFHVCTLRGEEWGIKYENFRVQGYKVCQSDIIAILHVKFLALVLPDLVVLTLVAFVLVLLSLISFRMKYF